MNLRAAYLRIDANLHKTANANQDETKNAYLDRLVPGLLDARARRFEQQNHATNAPVSAKATKRGPNTSTHRAAGLADLLQKRTISGDCR